MNGAGLAVARSDIAALQRALRPRPARSVPALAARFLRFNAVGAIALSVDSAGLALLCACDLSPAAARGLSLAAATGVAWILDRRYTFAPSRRGRLEESLRYLVIALLAQSQNYLLFLGLLALFGDLPPFCCALLGAAWATGFAFAGQLLFTFAPAAPPARHAGAFRNRRGRAVPDPCGAAERAGLRGPSDRPAAACPRPDAGRHAKPLGAASPPQPA